MTSGEVTVKIIKNGKFLSKTQAMVHVMLP